MIQKENLIAIAFDRTGHAYKYQYKLVKDSKSIQSFEKFAISKKFIYINYYYKNSGIFYKRKYLEI